MNDSAKEGHIFVCAACGKRSRDRYGEQRISRGWDESCMMNAVELPEHTLIIENGLVVGVTEDETLGGE
jgi:hypothetical protein